MAGLVNQETDLSVDAYLDNIENESKREDARKLLEMMKKVTGQEPKVWGDNYFIGFGKYKYKRKGGKEEFEWFNVGFAPRKSKLTIYLTYDIGKQEELLSKLGKYKHGKGCLYINKLADVDLKILEKMVEKSKEASWYQS